jgi:hypothetical protein
VTAPITSRLTLACVLLACGAPARTTPPTAPPGVLHTPSDYAGDFALDQHVTASFGDDSQSFRAVIEKRGDSLVMVALGPSGSRAFVLAQRGHEVTFESHLPRALPFPPEYMLLDVHRAWLVGLPGAPLADGSHTATIDGEEVTEVWADARVQSRAFRRLDGTPPGLLTITFEGGLDPRVDQPAPTRVVLDNGWFGYRLVLDELSRRALPP